MPDWINRVARNLRLTSASAAIPRLRPFGRGNAVTAHLKNLRRLKKSLDPIGAARHDAVRGEPNIQTDIRSTYEVGVIEAMQREMDRMKDSAMRALRAIDFRIKRAPPLPELEHLNALGVLEHNHGATLREWYQKLIDARRSFIRAKWAKTVFVRANNLTRDAKHPNVIAAILGIIAIWAVELFFNYKYLLAAGAGSPEEIFTLVFATATFNLTLGLSLGFFGARATNHVRPRTKIAGFLLMVILFGFILVLHFILAHYRTALDAATSDPDAMNDSVLMLKRIADARVGLWDRALAKPLAFLGDPYALLVFGAGLLFAIVAAFEGYFLLSDPYPGYSACDRVYRKAEAHNTKMNKDFADTIHKLGNDAKAKIDAELSLGQNRINTIKLCIDDAGHILRSYEMVATEIENTLLRMIFDYRDENRTIRNNSGPEFWSDDLPTLDRETPFELDSLTQIEERELANFRGLADAGEQLKARIAVEQAQMVAKVERFLETIDQHASVEDRTGLEPYGFYDPPNP